MIKKTKSIIGLIIWFIWATGKDVEALLRHATTADYQVLASYGVGPLFFVLALSVLVLNAASVYFLFRPALRGLKVIFAALIAAAIQNTIVLLFSLRDLSVVRDAYVHGRNARGLPVREEALDLIFTPGGMVGSVVLALAVYALLAFLAYRNRPYFRGAVA